MSVSPTSDLINRFLFQLQHTGPRGFEGLAATLLSAATQQHFRLSNTGPQSGQDARSEPSHGNLAKIETKHYSSSHLNLRELVAELVQATRVGSTIDIWVLVTSCAVPDQHATELESLAQERGVEILILDTNSLGRPRIALLMAAHADVTKRWALEHDIAFPAELSDALARFKAEPQFESKYEELRLKLNSTILGFEDARKRCAEKLLNVLRDDGNALRTFNQGIAVRSPNVRSVPRPGIRNSLEAWLNSWPRTQKHAVLLGEDGIGKTWAVMSWLAQLLEGPHFPIILPFAALAESLSSEDAVERLLPRLLLNWTGMGTTDSWARRVTRWLSGSCQPEPLIMLVADGLNERPDIPWPSFFRSIESQEWRERVAVLATDRSAHWDSSCAAALCNFQRLTAPGYTDQELTAALTDATIALKSIPDDLQVLIRKPRYCALVVNHFDEMQKNGDFTVERLILLDIRHRAELKRGHLTEDAFVEIIRRLSHRYRQKLDIDLSAIQALIPVPDSGRRIHQEIIDGGLLVRQPGLSPRFSVEPTRLIFGLGMFLAEELQDAASEENSPREIQQRLVSWFEPHPEIDLKVQICAAALFHTLIEASYPSVARRELLRYWLTLRNWDDRVQKAFVDYIARCPEDFIAVADEVWSSSRNLGAAQDFLTKAFLKYRDDVRVQPLLVAAVTRWMTLVHPAGSASGSGDPRREARVREEIRARVGGSLVPGSIQLCGENIVVVEDSGLMRLTRLAFLILSAGDRRPFLHSLVPWAVTSAVMEDSSTRSLADWVVRLSEEPIEELLQCERHRLLARGEPLAARAAHVLLWRIQPAEASAERQQNPIFQTEQWRQANEMYTRDPCRSFFPWTDADCLRCMDREDIPLTLTLDRIGNRLFDPTYKLPESLVERAKALLQFDVTTFRSALSATSEDHLYDDILPVLASRAPASLAAFVRRVVDTLPKRSFEQIYPASLWMPEFCLILRPSEIDAVFRLWEQLQDDRESDGTTQEARYERDRSIVEAFLLLSVAPRLQAGAFLSRLLERSKDARDLRQFEVWFPRSSDEAAKQAIATIHSAQDELTIARALWFSAGCKVELSEADRDLLILLVQSRNQSLRTTALRFVCSSDDPELATRVLGLGVSFRDQSGAMDSVWGARLLIRHSHNLEFETVCARLNEADAGYALRFRGFSAQDVKSYGEALDRGWKSIASASDSSIASLPVVEFNGFESPDGRDFPGFQNPQNFRVTFRNALSTWANHRDQSTPQEVFEALEDFQNTSKWAEGLNRRNRDNADALVAAWQKAAYRWFALDFSSSALAQVCRAMPETVKEWVEALLSENPKEPRLLTRFGTFFARLCPGLFEHNPPLGLKLWRYLSEESRYSLFDAAHAAFHAPDNPASQEARCEVLENCFDDASIAHVALVAELEGQQDWVAREIKRMLAEPALWKRARGLTLASFSNISPERFDSYVRQAMVEGSWVQDQVADLRTNIMDNHFAKHWFNLFLTDRDSDASWGALQMMLRCSDRRFYVWRRQHESSAAGAAGEKLRYLDSIEDDIQKAVDRVKERRDTLFGIKLERGEIFPFLETKKFDLAR